MPTSLTTLSTAFLTPAALALLGTTAIKATLILAVASALALAMRHSAASTRHLVWATSLAGIILLPALNVVLPGWYVALPGANSVRALGARLLPGPEASFKVTTHPTAPPAVQVPSRTAVAKSRATTTGSVVAKGSSMDPMDAPSFKASIQDASVSDGPPSPATILLEIWLAGVLVALLPVVIGRVQLARIAQFAIDVESDALDDFAARLARSLGVTRVIRLVEGGPTSSPMTWGTVHPVVLVPAGFAEWSEERQRDVLLHELAHIARYDCLTQNIARVACALYWFNPLAWLAARQLRIERERSCDDRVLMAGARPSAYAEHLLTIARTLHAPGATPVAALAMARPSQLEGRLLALLDAGRTRGAVTSRVAGFTVSVAIAVAATLGALQPWGARLAEAGEADHSRPVATAAGEAGRKERPSNKAATIDVDAIRNAFGPPAESTLRSFPLQDADAAIDSLRKFGAMRSTLDAVADRLTAGVGRLVAAPATVVVDTRPLIPGCETTDKGTTSTQVLSDDDDHMRARIKRGSCQILLETQGKVTYNDQFTDVATLARDGWFELSDKGGPVEHKLRIEPGSGESLTRTWTVDGARKPFDDAAKQWLATTLVELDRYTQFSNGARMAVVYKKSGVNGVLDEMQTTSSDYAKRENLVRLFKLAKLDDAQLGRVLDLVRTTVSSDYERSEILMALVKEGVITQGLQDKYIAAAAGMSSGYERGRSLGALTSTGKLSPASQAAIYKAAANTSSDYDRAQLMKAVMEKYGLSLETAPAFLATAKTISADYDLRTLLTEAVEQLPQDAPPAMIESMLATATSNIESEYDLAEFLITVAKLRPLDAAQRARIERAADAVKGEYNYGRVMSAIRARRTNSL